MSKGSIAKNPDSKNPGHQDSTSEDPAPEFEYDLFVIGAGSGGVRAARMAAAKGVKVGIAEDRYLGGTCVNVGCVPKKLFVYASHFREDFADAARYGWVQETSPVFNWQVLRDNKSREIERLNQVYAHLLENAGVELLSGHAKLLDAHHVRIGTRTLSARNILIAVGGWPYIPELPGAEYVISSNEVFYLESFPKRILIVGGGYIAVEFAGIFNGLGAATTLIYRGELFLRGFDHELRTFVAKEIEKKGVTLRFNSDVSKITKLEDGSLEAELNGGEKLQADLVLYATGRKPNTQGMGLDEAGVELNADGAIVVNQRFQTSVPSIYALGDVIDRVQLTPVAIAEAMALVEGLYGQGSGSLDYDAIPTAVFSQPSIATVGLTEDEAKRKHGEIAVYLSEFRPLKHTLSGNQERCFMKLVVEKRGGKVVGAHMVGAEAGEIIQGIAIAIKAGATKQIFDQTIGIHPSAAEEFVTMKETKR